jgi:tetratricopeptide (TPR) repeat protein
MVVPGDIIARSSGGSTEVFKLLETGERVLARSYWPVPENVFWPDDAFLVKSACEEIAAKLLKDALKIDFQPVSETDKKEVAAYRRISDGLAKRASELQRILSEADDLFGRKEWLSAMHLYTEAASFARNNPEIFLRRGECYRRLGMESEAKADFRHAEDLGS